MPVAALVPAAISGVGAIAGALSKKPQPQQVDLHGATQQQADQSFQNTQQGLAQQQSFLQALQGQNGIQNQSDVYNQLALQAQGGGPNPAQMALNNATGQNVANQAALMAGQRGAGANAGLIARQAAMQGGAIQQQAAGQGALMQAQQQQQAINSMGNIAGQQVGNQANATQAYGQMALGQQGNVLNSLGNQNNAAASLAGQANQVNMANSAQDGKMIGGLTNAAGAAAGLLSAPSSTPQYDYSKADGMGGGITKMAHGGTVPQSALGKALMGMKEGGAVPGKAKVSGDSLKNDTVDAKLSPGEIVIPRSVAMAKDAPKRAAEFVAALQARQKSSKRK